jgi:hypothetical protein
MLPRPPAIHGAHPLWHLWRCEYLVEMETWRVQTSKCLALLQSDAGSQPIPVIPDQLGKLEHNLLSRHYTRRFPCGKCPLCTLHGGLELRIGVLWYTRNEVVGGGVMKVDKLGGLGFEEFVVDKIRRVLDILDLLVCRRIAVDAERKSCCGLEVLSGGMQSAGGDLGGLSRGSHCEGRSCSWSSRYSSSNGTRENSSHRQSSLNRLVPWGGERGDV